MSQLLHTRALPEGLQSADRLPTLPGVALEVLNLCKDEDTTLEDLAEVLAHDPALSVRLLRFANSSIYNLGQEVTTIQRACLVLGMKTVQLMSLSFSLAESLPRNGKTGRFDYREYWHRSLLCAVAGRSMAGIAGLLGEEEAFLCGLLSHIGQIVMAECLPDQYELVMDAAEEAEGAGGNWPSAELEEQILGFDHADVGSALLESWGLPEIVSASVGAMYDPSRLSDSACHATVDFVRAMNLAALTVDLLTQEDKGAVLSKIEDRALDWFGLPPDAVYTYITSLEADIAEASELLNLELPEGEGHQKILDDARQQVLEISIGLGPQSTQIVDSRVGANLTHRSAILEESLLRDPISGVPNRQAFDKFIEQELLARTEGPLRRPLGLALIDLDEYDETAANFGQEAAEDVLRACGQALHILVRKGDLPVHLGDGHFAVIMSEGTPYGLRALAERVRVGIANITLEVEGQPLGVSATLAGACLGQVSTMADGKALFAAVEKILFRAKSKGRNHAVVHPTLLGSREVS